MADAYDAMSSERSYRPRFTQEKIVEEIKQGMGTQFDPTYAQIMLDIIEEDKEFKFRG